MQIERIRVDGHCPINEVERLWSSLHSGNSACVQAALDYTFIASYLPGKPEIALSSLVALYRDGSSHCVVLEREAFNKHFENKDDVHSLALKAHAAVFDLAKPLSLSPVHIPKPWGQEIWYTGMEERGQASVVSKTGSTSLPFVLSLFAKEENPISDTVLLKILDPFPEPVLGDLYFELHEKKQEVYVVTHVDPEAWPDGKGAIRFGFSKDKRSRFDCDDSFRKAYLEAVRAYRNIRRQLDALLDEKRQQAGYTLNAPVSPEILKGWLQALPAELSEEEFAARTFMESFTGLMPLEEGDVLAIPCFVPHALQHGVRTVEFQTPVYERKILSFAQKVLTQPGWDTEEALSLCELDEPALQPMKTRYPHEGVKVERIVDFDGFYVDRVCLEAGANYFFPVTGGEVLMGVTGCLESPSLIELLRPEKAIMFPKAARGCELTASENSTLLLAAPSAKGDC